MTYIGETFPEAPVRIGFPVGETPAEMAVIDAAADWCARKRTASYPNTTARQRSLLSAMQGFRLSYSARTGSPRSVER